LQGAIGVNADGVLGPISLSAITKAEPAALIHFLAQRQKNYYERLSTFATFGAGWTRRTGEREQAALKLVGQA
jgi:lysozyme family protein